MKSFLRHHVRGYRTFYIYPWLDGYHPRVVARAENFANQSGLGRLRV